MEWDPSIFLHAEHLSKEVPSGDSKISIFHNISLTIKEGESVAILGASGSGKTTLLTLLAGLDLPTFGDIYFQWHHLNKLSEEERAIIRGKMVGFIFQNFQLLPTLTALENVMLPLEIQAIKYAKCKEAAKNWLYKVGLENRLHHYPQQLSGGEQQRVAIARAFVTNPLVILADEMTGNLDTATGALIADILFDLNQVQRTTLVLVTHDVSLAARCQRSLLLQQGFLQPC
jgi:putative ABC transport system ATP-binding protein